MNTDLSTKIRALGLPYEAGINTEHLGMDSLETRRCVRRNGLATDGPPKLGRDRDKMSGGDIGPRARNSRRDIVFF